MLTFFVIFVLAMSPFVHVLLDADTQPYRYRLAKLLSGYAAVPGVCLIGMLCWLIAKVHKPNTSEIATLADVQEAVAEWIQEVNQYV